MSDDQIKSKIERTIPQIRAQGRNLKRPMPTTRPGSESASVKVASAIPVMPMTGMATAAADHRFGRGGTPCVACAQ